jgi:SAM-dependent methyltransferase
MGTLLPSDWHIDRIVDSGTSEGLTRVNPGERMTHTERAGQTTWGRYITDREHEAIKKAQEMLGTPGLAMDIGCESGRWSALLAASGWRMMCTEVRPRLLELCQQRIPAASCILVSPTDKTIPVKSGGMDLLLCMEVFPVIHSEWFPAEAARALRPGGMVVGVITNSICLRGIARRVRGRRYSRENRLYDYDSLIYRSSYRSWKKKMADGGLDVVHEEGMCWLPFSRSSNSALVPFLVKLERFLGLPRLPAFSPWIVFAALKTISH